MTNWRGYDSSWQTEEISVVQINTAVNDLEGTINGYDKVDTDALRNKMTNIMYILENENNRQDDKTSLKIYASITSIGMNTLTQAS